MSDDELLEAAPGRHGDRPRSRRTVRPRRSAGASDPVRPEGPGIPDLLPQHERIDRGDRERERDPAERAQAGRGFARRVARAPGGARARPARVRIAEPADDARAREAVALGEQRTRRARGRGTATRCTRPAGTTPSGRRRDTARCGAAPSMPRRSAASWCSRTNEPSVSEQRDQEPGQHVVAEEDPPEPADERWIQRMECGRRLVVAVLRDAKEEVAVPACPEVGEVPEVVQARRVPTSGVRVPVRLEEKEREDRREPDRRAAPEVDVQRGNLHCL